MKGHVQRRGKGSWRLKFDVGRDPVTGRRQTRYVTFRGSKRQAETELARLVSKAEEGQLADPKRTTLKEYLEHWLESYAKPEVSAKTYERYEEIVRKHLIPGLGNIKLRDLGSGHIQAYYAEALEKGRLTREGGLSARTVHHHHRILYRALNQAVHASPPLLAKNPADKHAVKPPKPEHREIQALDEKELGALLRTARSTRLYTAVLLAATTGLRRGEVLALRWKDIDGDRLTVAQALEQTKAGLRFKAPKTKRSRRTVTLPGVTVDAFKAHRKRQAEERLALGLGKDPRDLGFTNIEGEPVNPRNFSKEFGRIVKRAKVPRITFHGLRHTHLTHLLRSGVNPKVASERAGHASVAVTLDVYSHVLPGMQEDVARGVDATIRTVLEQ